MLNHRLKRQIYVLIFVLLCSFVLGWGISLFSSESALAAPTELVGGVEAIAPEYEAGHQLYLENCASCHVGVPPAVLPTQSWLKIVTNPTHYSVKLKPLPRFSDRLVLNYLRQYSRNVLPSEIVPLYLRDSRYFKALHPQVKFTQPIQVSSCVSCHSQADKFNYRTFSESE
jgi:cbb3-type cytochrome oxidase cytochrome c subunit